MKKSLKGRQSCCFVAVVVVVVVMRKTKLFSFNLAQKKLGGAGRPCLNKLVVFVAAFLSKMSKKFGRSRFWNLEKKVSTLSLVL